MGNGVASQHLTFAVVIRSAFARGYGATGETLNRYIGGGRKHDQRDGFAWYRQFVTRNTVSSRMETSQSPLATASKL